MRPPPPATPPPPIDPATAKAAEAAADAYLARQDATPSEPATPAGMAAITEAEVDLMQARTMIAGHQADHASTPYLAASQRLNAITAEDRHRLGKRFRTDLEDLESVSLVLLGTTAVDPASHPPTSKAENTAANDVPAVIPPPKAPAAPPAGGAAAASH